MSHGLRICELKPIPGEPGRTRTDENQGMVQEMKDVVMTAGSEASTGMGFRAGGCRSQESLAACISQVTVLKTF